MAEADPRTVEQVRRELAEERDRLAGSIASLRAELGSALDVSARLRGKVPIVAAGALAAGFVAAGGIGATMRLLARRSREGHRRGSLGRFTVVERD